MARGKTKRTATWFNWLKDAMKKGFRLPDPSVNPLRRAKRQKMAELGIRSGKAFRKFERAEIKGNALLTETKKTL